MFLRKLIPLSLVVVLALFAGIHKNVVPGSAQDNSPAPLAPVGTSFTYQGQLKDSSGNPITGNCDFRFILFDAEVGGAQIVPIQEKTAIAVADGYFTVLLDFGGAAFTGEARWLEAAVKCSGEADYTTLSPRQALTAAPYAIYAQTVGPHSHWGDTWSGSGVGLIITSTDDLGLEASGINSGIYGHSVNGNGLTGWVSATSGQTTGIYGQSDSTDGRGVHGFTKASSGYTYGVWGQSDSTDGSGVYGYVSATSGVTYGLFGNSESTNGSGVYGLAGATIGETRGVMGEVASPDGRGVWGLATATNGFTNGVTGEVWSPDGRGVWGYSGATSGNASGVLGESHSSNSAGVVGEVHSSSSGVGVRGMVTATTGWAIGVYGESASTEGAGVYGEATSTSGLTYGVYGKSNSTSGNGVYGEAAATSGFAFGVYGRSYSNYGGGIHGEAWSTSGTTFGVFAGSASTSGMGVYGVASATSGTTYGVYGHAHSTNGYGVYSWGNFAATGTKSAIVDTQSYNWLHLYSVESPDVLFEDTGTAQMVDGVGMVFIDPRFAETVNLDVPYQVFVTPLGDCALYVTDKTSASFTVRALGGAQCSLDFDYRIVAKRLGYEDVRMAPATDPNEVVPNDRLAEESQPPEELQP